MSEKLWETCREAKDTMQPHKTNQDIADESGVSVNAVSQFLRGETTKPYINTVGPICASLGVSMDEHFGVPPAEPAVCQTQRGAADAKAQRSPRESLACVFHKKSSGKSSKLASSYSHSAASPVFMGDISGTSVYHLWGLLFLFFIKYFESLLTYTVLQYII